MGRDIKLSGGEITLLKQIGTGGAPISGKLLLDKLETAERPEFVETLTDLIEMGYVVSNKVNIRTVEEAETAFFRVSPAHAKDLRDAMHPGRKREQTRSRRERRG